MSTPHRRRHPVLVHLPFGMVLAVVALGLFRIVLYHWRQGTVLIGIALFLAAGLRALLTDEQAGLILIRGRGVDVLTYSAFGACMILVAMTIEGGPLGN
ncbi:DUF3017 domain-containing protein [Actinophytocola algeriensis]|jgi:hypothetical protein|uniref:Putative membrane protein n=1 Tax=Actinophytocola algeriensis TaxID=1768010 RepID=A0A7W7QEH8_9PSEU|nr:DUF3017 domain-containing protein [Actinophytocola algeriensis]MBB4912137.1 putative membrane protein [Actinophytocola algeriensis]MBE1477371.1 putative membrane protein [Actinophytocola algeriensis]